jgi:AraC family transcriptional regulator
VAAFLPIQNQGGWGTRLIVRGSVKSIRKGSKEVPLSGGLHPRVLRLVTEYMKSHLHERISVRGLAQVARMSPYHFGRLFKQSTNLSPHQYLLELRIRRAKELLEDRGLSLAEISSQLGFASRSHFTTVFRKRVGTPPKEFRLKQQS